MKNFYYVIIFALLLTASCSEEEKSVVFEDTQVKIDKSEVSFSAEGGTGTIVVASSQPITAKSDQSWCSVNVGGNTVTVTVGQNISMNGRTALVTINEGEKINYVPVTQYPVYLELNDYGTVSFLGKGETIPIKYKSIVPVSVVNLPSWLNATVNANEIVLEAIRNPEWMKSRNATITLIAGDNLVIQELKVLQGELIYSAENDPEIDVISKFLNLKNNPASTPTSRYLITTMCARMETLRTNLKTAYPVFQELRIEAPLSSYKASFIFNNGSSNHYLVCTDGMVPIDNSKYKAYFAYTGTAYSGTAAPYTSNTNYTQLGNIFIATAGFTIIMDGDAYWFRSIADPTNHFRVEPATW